MTERQRPYRKHTVRTPGKKEVSKPRSPQEILEEKREALRIAQEDYERECVRKHGKPSVCEELGGFLATAAKGVGYGLGKLGYAAQEMGRMTEEDLYRHSPAGQRDRALMRMLQNKNPSIKSSGTHSRARKPQYVVILNKDGSVKEVIDKNLVQDNSRKRRRY